MTYARAMGPMQFLPGTWSRYASDGDGDGKAEVQNLFDSTLAAARYLCSGGLNLRDQSHVMAAILRYNNSMAYARNVLGWAGAYATGVVPVDLPPITGPVPAIGDAHLEHSEGLGPGLPLNATGLPANDPLALIPLVDRPADAGQIPTNLPGFVPGQMLGRLPGPPPAPQAPPAQPPPWLPPWMQPPQPARAVFCLGENTPAPVPPEALPPGGAPPGAPPAPGPPPLILPGPPPLILPGPPPLFPPAPPPLFPPAPPPPLFPPAPPPPLFPPAPPPPPVPAGPPPLFAPPPPLSLRRRRPNRSRRSRWARRRARSSDRAPTPTVKTVRRVGLHSAVMSVSPLSWKLRRAPGWRR